MTYESTLAQISEQVFSAKTAQEAKNIIVDHLKNTKVKDKDKMINDVSVINNLVKVQMYFSNALLKFEGMGSNQMNKEAKQ